MSSASEFDTELQLLQTGLYIAYSANILYLWESCITFSQEIDVVWGRKWTVMTWLYMITHYGAILLNFIELIPPSAWAPGVFYNQRLNSDTAADTIHSCRASTYMADVLYMLQLLCFALFSGLRIHALLDGKILAGIVFLLNLVPLGTNMASSNNYTTNEFNLGSWFNTDQLRNGDDLSLSARISAILGDILVLLVTWSKTAKLHREARQLNIKAPLATLLFCDGEVSHLGNCDYLYFMRAKITTSGTSYFVILLILNIFRLIQTISNIQALLLLQIPAPFSQMSVKVYYLVKPAGSSSNISQAGSNYWQEFSLDFMHVGGLLETGELSLECEADDQGERKKTINLSNVPQTSGIIDLPIS
ncbi:hypothetical protein BDY19DRAFT_909860 [Irpex rosettiformis]|uniref:Uncharacterized protein n=1 Tax=Irpex rosettiformis TaxID=378272 RepID=A0ACB8TRD2_9APHY|nr:hypothetical protein BDY19DRAFT_909860 [Irpex rosettiformis]